MAFLTPRARRIGAVALGGLVLSCLAIALVRQAGGGAWGYFTGRPDRPVIYVETQAVDLGRLGPSETAEREVGVENRGGRTLKMQTPTASCGCQKPVLDRLILEPGESTTLRLKQSASPNPGPFSHFITVPSNDPVVPSVQIHLTGFMSRKIVVRPDPVFLGSLAPGETTIRLVDVASEEGSEFRLTHAYSGGVARVKAILDRPAKLHRLTVTFQAGDALGPFHEVVNFDTDVKGEPPQQFAVTGEIVGPVRPSPSRMDLGTVLARAEITRRILLTSRSGPVQVVGMKLLRGIGWRLTHESKHSADSKQIAVVLSLRPPDFPGIIEDTMEVDVKDEKGADVILNIPVTGVIERGSGDGNQGDH